jgi:hypothetical protein
VSHLFLFIFKKKKNGKIWKEGRKVIKKKRIAAKIPVTLLHHVTDVGIPTFVGVTTLSFLYSERGFGKRVTPNRWFP